MTSISDLKLWLTCPQKHHFATIEKRVPVALSPALDLGNTFHRFMEARLKGAPSETLLALAPETPDAQEEWQKLLPFIAAWPIPPEWRIVAVEYPLSGTLGAHQIQGRLDALIYWNSKYWSLQYKTCGQSTPLDNLADSVRLGFHEAAYQYLAETSGHVPFGGTILLTARKLSLKAIREGSNPLMVHYLTRSPSVQSEILSDLILALDLSETTRFRNLESCYGPFKNTKCPYLPVCHEGLSISSDLYQDAEDRYADLES